MSMNATESELSASATFVATVDFPLPEPPAMPMMRGFDTLKMYGTGSCVGEYEVLWRAMIFVGARWVLRCLKGGEKEVGD